MKTISKICTLGALLLLAACQQNEEVEISVPEDAYGTVEFSFDVKDSEENADGRKSAAARTEEVQPSQIVITIENSSGELIHDALPMPLTTIGGAYITNQLTLIAGNYRITEYFVEDAEGNVLYVTPQEASNLAYLVDNPLPIDLVISKDVNSQESPEVVSTEGATAEDFGYPSFRLNIVKTIDFLVSVHVLNAQTGTYELTDAGAQVTGDGNTAFDGSLAAITNQIRVSDRYSDYTVNISKAGYTPYLQLFTKESLQAFENEPLYVLLDPEISTFDILANENSVSGGVGVVIDDFLSGDIIRLSADEGDTWQLHEDGDIVTNGDGQEGAENAITIGGQTFQTGTLVGSFDGGLTYFSIGTSTEIAPTADGQLTLWCWDSDKDNNSDFIAVSVQTFR